MGWGAARKQAGSSSEIQMNGKANPFATGFLNLANKSRPARACPHDFVDSKVDFKVQEAEDLVLRGWRALECFDVGRVDVRYGADDKPYVRGLQRVLIDRPHRAYNAQGQPQSRPLSRIFIPD